MAAVWPVARALGREPQETDIAGVMVEPAGIDRAETPDAGEERRERDRNPMTEAEPLCPVEFSGGRPTRMRVRRSSMGGKHAKTARRAKNAPDGAGALLAWWSFGLDGTDGLGLRLRRAG